MELVRFGTAEALEQLPSSLKKLMTFERFHLHRPDVFQAVSDPSFDVRYLPQNCNAFELPCFWIPRKHFYVYGRQLGDGTEISLFDRNGVDERVLLPIHPVELTHYKDFLRHVRARDAALEGLRIWATPTSSTRTLLAWPDNDPGSAVFIKTSLHSTAFGDRRMSRIKVGAGVGLSGLVQQTRTTLPRALCFFFESVGYVPRSLPNCGVIIRSIPAEIKSGEIVVAPLFSLMGGNDANRPVLFEILDRSGMQAAEFIETILCARFARVWVEMSMRHGLMLESHGQDLMLALSDDMIPIHRFYYRDFEGLAVDWDLRRVRGFGEPELPNLQSWFETYATWGYPCYQLVWCKWRASLYQYLYFVLNELDSAVCEWQRQGLVGGGKLSKDFITSTFSRHIRDSVYEICGVREVREYNIAHSLNRFVRFLFDVRRRFMRTEATNESQSLQ